MAFSSFLSVRFFCFHDTRQQAAAQVFHVKQKEAPAGPLGVTPLQGGGPFAAGGPDAPSKTALFLSLPDEADQLFHIRKVIVIAHDSLAVVDDAVLFIAFQTVQ